MIKNSKSKGFTRRVKKRWDLELPEQASVSIHNLRNDASHFQKEPEIRNLVLVKNRSKIDGQ